MPRVAKTTRHGMRYSRAYASWVAMKSRCLSPTNTRYKDYGGRGIRVCDDWILSFVAFHNCVGDPPSPSHTIDRIDSNGNYDPGNVKWSTPTEQIRNRRKVLTVTHLGQTMSIAEWAYKLGISYNTLVARYHRNEPPESILRTRRSRHANG